MKRREKPDSSRPAALFPYSSYSRLPAQLTLPEAHALNIPRLACAQIICNTCGPA